MIEVNKENLVMTMRSHKICVLVPTYNNAGTLAHVIKRILDYSSDVIVVNDGSTDSTQDILNNFSNSISIVSYTKNQGKGTALKRGFKKAIELGYEYAITIDSDGQHYPEDIPLFVEAIVENPGSLIVGQRDLSNVDINGKSSFANKFSNFWFCVQTGKNLKDTQTGYRAYPLKKLYGLRLLTSRYEAELELLVFASWNGVNIISIPIQVYYPPQSERISHFKPALDFTRISILNTILCIAAIIYGLPARLFYGIKQKRFFNTEFKPFTRKHGVKKEAATTLGRLFRSIYGISHFVFWSLAVFTPVAYIYLGIGKTTEKKKIRFHKMLQWISSFFARNFPGSGTVYDNPSNETYDKPAMIVCNHQSHLDLPVLMSVSHKFIFLTNDWVWNNFFFGKIVHWAEYLPVSAGIDIILPQLKDLVKRGYSIVVFPEGTRSADCTIQRFHQGAFHLAKELNIDILPMVLHGAGEYLPKKDFMFRHGMITLKTLTRITQAEYESILLRKQASATRKLINDEFNAMIRKIETPQFFKSLVLYKYAYRGWSTVSRCKHVLKNIDVFSSQISNIETQSVWFINSGIGIIPLLCALSNKDVKVYGLEEKLDDYNISVKTAGLPDNIQYNKVIWEEDYDQIPKEALVFVIGTDNEMERFRRFNPTLIRCNYE